MTTHVDRLQRRPATTPCYLRGNLWDEHVDGESHLEQEARHAEARRICATCPVKVSCLRKRATEGGIGIWGGRLFKSERADQPSGELAAPRLGDGRCRHCGAAARITRRGVTGYCGEPCRQAHYNRLSRKRRADRVAEQVAHVLHGGTPDGISRPAREQLIDHWTAAGRSGEWIAARVGLAARNVLRHQVARRATQPAKAA